MKPAVFAALLLTCVVASADRVYACDCTPVGPPCKAAWQGVVFVGKVTAITPELVQPPPARGKPTTTGWLRVRFTVSEQFRGDVPETFEVFTHQTGAACGYAFSKDRSYVVYGHWDQVKERWRVFSCDRTRPLSAASEDLKYLRSLTPESRPCRGASSPCCR